MSKRVGEGREVRPREGAGVWGGHSRSTIASTGESRPPREGEFESTLRR